VSADKGVRPELLIRPMHAEDLERILEIETVSFASPWTWNHFKEELTKTYGRLRVAISGQRIAGYLITWLIEDELHIANLAVHPDFRRQGIAEKLVRTVLDEIPHCSLATLEVRESNSSARRLYEKLGFAIVGIRKKYYEKEGEDALIMSKFFNQSNAMFFQDTEI
jgi:ribosomal-protein-alanine N-acetyltransferase